MTTESKTLYSGYTLMSIRIALARLIAPRDIVIMTKDQEPLSPERSPHRGMPSIRELLVQPLLARLIEELGTTRVQMAEVVQELLFVMDCVEVPPQIIRQWDAAVMNAQKALGAANEGPKAQEPPAGGKQSS